MGVAIVPESYMGQTLQEAEIKRVLIELDPAFHFDVGANLNIWHPYQSRRQGVWYSGKHICAMDRGTIPEFPIWSMKEEIVSVPTHTLRWADILDPTTMEEFVVVDGKEVLTGTSAIKKKVRDKILLVGWRHTLEGILRQQIPTVTQADLQSKLRVNLDWKEDKGSLETDDNRVVDQRIVVA